MVIKKYKRHNWTMLQEEFIKEDYKTLKEFAAFTYINDTRSNHCTIRDIAEWYGLDYELVKARSIKEHWEKYRVMEKKNGYGVCEFIDNHRD